MTFLLDQTPNISRYLANYEIQIEGALIPIFNVFHKFGFKEGVKTELHRGSISKEKSALARKAAVAEAAFTLSSVL